MPVTFANLFFRHVPSDDAEEEMTIDGLEEEVAGIKKHLAEREAVLDALRIELEKQAQRDAEKAAKQAALKELEKAAAAAAQKVAEARAQLAAMPA